jgi:hypothetical protein
MDRSIKSVYLVKPASQGPQYQLHALGAGTEAEPPNNPTIDIHLRATVVGPVLEEILQSHWEYWEHWG